MYCFNKPDKREEEMNITSLIDVIFMLLIFFMIGTSFTKPAISIQLPAAKAGTQIDDVPIEILISHEGQIFLENQPVKAEELTEVLKKKERIAEKTVAIYGDGKVLYEKILAVIDSVRQGGVHRVALKHEYKNP